LSVPLSWIVCSSKRLTLSNENAMKIIVVDKIYWSGNLIDYNGITQLLIA